MSAAVPRIAVVGRTNEGKTSVVAALTEHADLAIADEPGTTTVCQAIDIHSDETLLFRLYDTPGFEDADAVLAWLQAQETHAADHPAAVAAFLAAHEHGAAFREECHLLRPIVNDEAGIIYVVDGSHPFSADFQSEMEILRWCGRPRMALINPKGGREHINEWQTALGQYFGIVRVFDAHDAPWAARLDLLGAFRELQHDDEGRKHIDRAITVLRQQDERRAQAAAAAIADLLVDGIGLIHEIRYGDQAPVDDELKAGLCAAIDRRWQDHQRLIESTYRHRFNQRQVAAVDGNPFADSLFSQRTWELFGLSRTNLALLGLVVGASVGAPIGGSIDIATLGHSFGLGTMLGTLVGAGSGALSALFAGRGLGAKRLLGHRLGARVARLGPIKDPRFAWILFDLALLHHRAIRLRSHARRDPFVFAASDGKHGLAERLPHELRRGCERCFHAIRQRAPEVDPDTRATLSGLIAQAMAAG